MSFASASLLKITLILLCDTNFLIKVANEPLPGLKALIDEEGYELRTVREVERELEGLARGKGSVARRARRAIDCLGKSVKVEASEESEDFGGEADRILMQRAEDDREVIVATLDGKLLSRLERDGRPYLTLRNDRPFIREARSRRGKTAEIGQHI